MHFLIFYYFFTKVGYCSQGRLYLSHGAELDMLDNDTQPAHIRLYKILLAENISQAEKVQALVNQGILQIQQSVDKRVHKRLLSPEHGTGMLSHIAAKLLDASGYPNGEIASICPEMIQPFNAQTPQVVRRSQSAIRRLKADDAIFNDFRNTKKGPHGETFVEVLSIDGSLTRYSKNRVAGARNNIYSVCAQNKYGGRQSLVVKIPIVVTKTCNAILLHENYVLKNLESVETVVKQYGQGIWDVHGHNVLALHSVPTGTTDQRALQALNVNDMLTIAAQLLETFKQAHEFETQHLALTRRHLLYDQVSKIVIVTGWGSSTSKGIKSPAGPAQIGFPTFDNVSNQRKDSILVATVLIDLLARCGSANGHTVKEVMTQTGIVLTRAMKSFNEPVADKLLRIQADHPLLKVIKSLLTGTIKDGLINMSEWGTRDCTQWSKLVVPARFNLEHQTMQYPGEVFKRMCVDKVGKPVSAVGLRALVLTPDKALIADYGGPSIDATFSTKLISSGSDTHIIGGPGKNNMKDGRRVDNGIYDALYYAENAQVNCNDDVPLNFRF